MLWTDIEGARLWMHTPADGGTRTWTLPGRLGSMAVCRSGRLLLGLAKGLVFTDVLTDLDAATRDDLRVHPVVPVDQDVPSTRVNAGRTDRAGNFVFGTMSEREEEVGNAPTGRFYQDSVQFGLRQLALGPVRIANSICFSLDGRTMYFCDSPQRRILQCDYDPDSAGISNVREFVLFGANQGLPDGSVIDLDGCLWNAEWGAGMVRRYTPRGRIDRQMAPTHELVSTSVAA